MIFSTLFFSTISFHLEPHGWGSQFPELMNELYQGKLDASRAKKVLGDLLKIKQELKKHRPDEIVWDIENLNAPPPWGKNISSEITDLSNYFVTSTGRDLFEVLTECLTALHRKGGSLSVEQY